MISHDSSTPLYLQLEELIENAIYGGRYKPGDKLPSESELCKKYGVSRITVRQTLNLLIQKDMVYSVHGKGTFVKIPEINHELTQIVRFGTSLKQKGLNGYTQVHSFYPKAKNDKAFGKLESDFCNLNLVGYAQDTPVVYYQSYVRSELSSQMYRVAKNFELQHTAFSSYDLYDKMKIKLCRVEQVIGAVNSDKQLNEVFNLTGEPALIMLESTYYSDSDVALEFKTAYYRADIYTFHLQRKLAEAQ